MKKIFITLLITLSIAAYCQEKNKIAVLGSFHFHLVKPQFGVDFDVHNTTNQNELNEIAKKIEEYKPTKIFVEWDYSKQKELDDLFELFLKDKSYKLIKDKYGKNETMYFESEIQQLGFRIADRLKLKKLYAFDYFIDEPNDTIMKSIQKNNQQELMNVIQKDYGVFSQRIISEFKNTSSIKDMLLFFNSEEVDNQINDGYVSYFNKIGGLEDFSGAYFVSQRYKRNLYMYSLIQKQVNPTDERILVIVGVQHSAGIKDFIKKDYNFELVDISQILN